MTQKIYSYKETGEYVGESLAKKDPLEKEERYLIPRNSTTTKPDSSLFGNGKLVKFINGAWIQESISEEIAPTAAELFQEAKEDKLAAIANKASSLITTPYPIHTQLNYLAEVSTIQDKQINSEIITQDELDFLEQAKTVKAFINGIRNQSKAFVLQVNDESYITADDIKNIDITFI